MNALRTCVLCGVRRRERSRVDGTPFMRQLTKRTSFLATRAGLIRPLEVAQAGDWVCTAHREAAITQDLRIRIAGSSGRLEAEQEQ